MKAGYPWVTTTLMALLYISAITSMFSTRLQKRVHKLVDKYRDLNQELCPELPAALTLAYAVYCCQSGQIDWKILWVTSAYFFIPSKLLSSPELEKNVPGLKDFLALGILWLAFDTRLFGLTTRAGKIERALDFHIIQVSGVIISLTFWMFVRKFEGLKIKPPFRLSHTGHDWKTGWKFESDLRDWMTTVHGTIYLLFTVLPLGLLIGFLKPSPYWFPEIRLHAPVSVIQSHLMTWKVLGGIAGYGVTVAFAEEFWCRAILHNLLERYWPHKDNPKFWIKPLAISSIIFGLSHLNNGKGPWNWKYALVASVAGFIYGWVYRSTSSLFFPILLHAIVDTISFTFFASKIMEAFK